MLVLFLPSSISLSLFHLIIPLFIHPFNRSFCLNFTKPESANNCFSTITQVNIREILQSNDSTNNSTRVVLHSAATNYRSYRTKKYSSFKRILKIFIYLFDWIMQFVYSSFCRTITFWVRFTDLWYALFDDFYCI